ncbi:type IV secretory system conjugative DNA transfer family protein, partial [Streptomyces sp. NPDC046876]|uniref:type IV secretory system conjugative DNA transfer family protein n=1 Tax=Streptomyces sp. NPDC046876 TaxID=3155616 RepID=UPI0033C7D440
MLDYVFDDQDAQSVSVTIAKNSTKDGKEDFFMERAQKMLAGLIVYCKTEIPNASMQDVLDTFNERVAPDEEAFRQWVDEDLGPHHPAYQLLKGLTTLGGNTRTSVTSSFASQVSIFTLKKIREMTQTSDFNFRAFQEQKSILYVKLPMDENPFTALTSVFFDQLISQFYKLADENRGQLKIPTIFLLDEFANIGKIEKYARVLATCRGLGLSMNTIVQDNGQIESLYGKEMARSILSNHDTLLFLRSKDIETIVLLKNGAAVDLATLENAKEIFGEENLFKIVVKNMERLKRFDITGITDADMHVAVSLYLLTCCIDCSSTSSTRAIGMPACKIDTTAST